MTTPGFISSNRCSLRTTVQVVSYVLLPHLPVSTLISICLALPLRLSLDFNLCLSVKPLTSWQPDKENPRRYHWFKTYTVPPGSRLTSPD